MSNTDAEVEALKELLREEILASQGRWMAGRITNVIPELNIECDDEGWTWSYRCLEQTTASKNTPFDALLDFVVSSLDTLDLTVAFYTKHP
jgi:hypothetical protein